MEQTRPGEGEEEMSRHECKDCKDYADKWALGCDCFRAELTCYDLYTVLEINLGIDIRKDALR